MKEQVCGSIPHLGSSKNAVNNFAAFLLLLNNFMDIQILVQKFCDYSSFIRGRANGTIKRYRDVMRFYCNHFQLTEIEQVNEDNVRDLFYHGRTARNWSTQTYISYLKTFMVFFRWCVAEGYMQSNPAEKIEAPRLEKRLPVKLSKQEAMRVLEVVFNYPYDYKFLRFRNHAIFAMFIYSGLRKSELLHLTLTDVDIENLSILVRQGKGAKDRIVPISYTLAEILKKYLVERQRLHKTCPEFFVSLNRNMGFTHVGLKHVVEKVRVASKIPFTIHRLRHTFATLMLEGGCDIYSLSKMMGHSDIKTTTIYLAASIQHLRSQIIKHPLNDI